MIFKKITRDVILFTSGLILIFNEGLLRDGPERPYLLVLYGAMIGLPFVFRGDEIRNKMMGNSTVKKGGTKSGRK